MTKREKVLLQLMICIGVVGVIAVYVLLPQVKKNRSLKSDYDTVTFQAEDMEMMLSQDGVAEGLEKAEATTDETWSFFQKGLSSYEIDSFINGLAIDNDLTVEMLSIGSYSEVSDEEIGIPATEVTVDSDSSVSGSVNEEDKLLEKASVLVNVTGDYEDVLAFISQINERSECIQIASCSMSKDITEVKRDEEGNVIEDFDYTSAQITLNLYSIISYERWKNNSSNAATDTDGGEVVW